MPKEAVEGFENIYGKDLEKLSIDVLTRTHLSAVDYPSIFSRNPNAQSENPFNFKVKRRDH